MLIGVNAISSFLNQLCHFFWPYTLDHNLFCSFNISNTLSAFKFPVEWLGEKTALLTHHYADPGTWLECWVYFSSSECSFSLKTFFKLHKAFQIVCRWKYLWAFCIKIGLHPWSCCIWLFVYYWGGNSYFGAHVTETLS